MEGFSNCYATIGSPVVCIFLLHHFIKENIMKSIRHQNENVTPKLITRNYEIAQRRDEEQTFQAIEERIREQLHEAGAASLFKITKLKRVETDTDDCNLVFYTFDLKTFEDDHEKYINYTSINGGADVKTDI